MTDITDSTISRRRALQAGVGAGVGLVAWSGATITSMGGTPAYAAACTFAIEFTLWDDWRNTDQSCSNPPLFDLGYHPPNVAFPTDFFLDPVIASPRECGHNEHKLVHPDDYDCEVRVKLKLSNSPNAVPYYDEPYSDEEPYGAPGSGLESINFVLPSGSDAPGSKSNTFYQVYVRCVTAGSDPECFD